MGRSADWKLREPKELLIELLTPGSDPYGGMIDADVWQLGLRYCRDTRGLDGNQTIMLSRALNYFCIVRAGGTIDPVAIP